MINHIKRWNKWRKNSLNSSFYKLLVLLKPSISPTFQSIYWFDKTCKQNWSSIFGDNS